MPENLELEIPFYSAADLERLLKLWVSGSLDGIHGHGHAMVGVEGCDRVGYGFRPQSLPERFTSEELRQTIELMGTMAEPAPTHAVMLLLKHVAHLPIQDLARAMGYRDCSHAQSELIRAQDRFMALLLKN